MTWQEFVIAYGSFASLSHLSAVLNVSEADVMALRNTGVCVRRARNEALGFDELFALRHGREPTDADWPVPRRRSKGDYEWQARELRLLATLVGTTSIDGIVKIMSTRLRTITGDVNARRNRNAVQLQINRIGLQQSDVVGGITIADAAREIGSRAVLDHAVRAKLLKTYYVGRLRVIPHEEWRAYKSREVKPPDGYVRLSTLKQPLGIRSDKMSEWARDNLIPTAVRCKVFGVKGPSTQFGTWYLDEKVAQQLIADRQAGRPMPWHGRPFLDNLKTTFKLWNARKHPIDCDDCQQIWGEQGVPATFDDYRLRYPPLNHGAKRHLTRVWTPGLTIAEVAKDARQSVAAVKRAIENGALETTQFKLKLYVSRTAATRWKARRCPTGESMRSWLSLRTASKQYGFTASELNEFIATKSLEHKIGDNGPMRGVVYVSRNQCAALREKMGYTESQAAERLGIAVEALRVILQRLQWRKAKGIPLAVVQAAKHRLQSSEGSTIAEAADEVGRSVRWIQARINDGTVRVQKTHWSDRVYLSKPMVARLRVAAKTKRVDQIDRKEWLSLSDAAMLAGVSVTTLNTWGDSGFVRHRQSSRGAIYLKESVIRHARHYWSTSRWKRKTMPDALAS